MGIPDIDNRGLKSLPSKIPDIIKNSVINYFKSIPIYKSRYTRKGRDKKYLPPHWSLTSLYSDNK